MATIGTTVDTTIEKLEDQLKLWGAKLNELTAKSEVAGQQAKIQSKKQLEELKGKVAAAQAKLDESKAAGSEKWDSFKEGVTNSWKELEDAFKGLGR